MTATITTTAIPDLPVEIVEAIISTLWYSDDLLLKDRIIFMKSSVLVNSSWALLFIRVSAKDVHIPSPSYATKFLNILRGESVLYNACGVGLHNHFTRSITFQYEGDPDKMMVKRAYSHPMALAILSVFHVLFIPTSFTERLPNLRRISIELVNCTLDDFFSRIKFFMFPRQVTHFDLRFEYSPCVDSKDLFEIQGSEEPVGLVPGSVPNLKHLSLYGATKVVLQELLWACSNLETLETDVIDYDGPYYDEEPDSDEEVDEAEDDEDEDEYGIASVRHQTTEAFGNQGKGEEDVDSGYGSTEEQERDASLAGSTASSRPRVYSWLVPILP
ncbi:hypothetical protein K435DRAFT_777860 [Dendrothele bispora CBS 962.96]|uniref:F-box domain-containing protein n=1 Tax=Dendrothele bispora (strain CBS 962.96) TaxID=1314807 RepID=A0A4S8M686_DENBC|nr:hypothetical protein K435DRAFT_777860 [Dendrothele bispora CBS 962.96]